MAFDETATDNSVIAHLKFVTLQLLRGLRDNALAMNAQTSGAPVQAGVWHPYNMVTVGDGADGKFYDFDDDGVQASIETPNFEDGYEYRIIGKGLNKNGGTGLATLRVEFYKSVDAGYSGAVALVTQGDNEEAVHFDIEVLGPRIPRKGGAFRGVIWDEDNIFGGERIGGFGDGTEQVVDKLRFSWNTDSVDDGQLFLYRRRMLL